jgi:hypothetical protein
VWRADTFGYASQLPQIMTLSGIKSFLTQKVRICSLTLWPMACGSQSPFVRSSTVELEPDEQVPQLFLLVGGRRWYTRLPLPLSSSVNGAHTCGLCGHPVGNNQPGTRVITHFPAADTYCAHAKVEDVLKSATNFKVTHAQRLCTQCDDISS